MAWIKHWLLHLPVAPDTVVICIHRFDKVGTARHRKTQASNLAGGKQAESKRHNCYTCINANSISEPSSGICKIRLY